MPECPLDISFWFDCHISFCFGQSEPFCGISSLTQRFLSYRQRRNLTPVFSVSLSQHFKHNVIVVVTLLGPTMSSPLAFGISWALGHPRRQFHCFARCTVELAQHRRRYLPRLTWNPPPQYNQKGRRMLSSSERPYISQVVYGALECHWSPD